MYVKYNTSNDDLLFSCNKKAQMLGALGFVVSGGDGGDGGDRTHDLRIMNDDAQANNPLKQALQSHT